MKRSDGFTIIEVLVAIGVLAIIAAVLINFFTSSISVTANANALAREYRELQNTAAVVGDDIRRAQLIFDEGSSIDLAVGATAPAGAPTVTGPQAVAMLVPKVAGSTCTGEREFVAYFIAPRSTFVEATMPEWTNPGEDLANASSNVLMQYLACATGPLSAVVLTDPFIRMVADYMDETNLATFSKLDPGTVTMRLRSKRVVRGNTQYVPNSTGFVTLTVSARNIL